MMFDFTEVLNTLAAVGAAAFGWISPAGFIGAVVALGIIGSAVFEFIGSWVYWATHGELPLSDVSHMNPADDLDASEMAAYIGRDDDYFDIPW